MQTATLTPLAIATELRKIEHITIGNFIRKSITDETVIGITVMAPSSIRKQVFTLPFMQNWCRAYGFTLTDSYPCSHSMQIYFN